MFQGIADNLGPTLDTTISLADAGFGFLADNIEWLIPVVSGLTGAFAAYKAIMLGITIAQKAKAALDIAQLLVTGQLTAANTALAASTLGGNMARPGGDRCHRCPYRHRCRPVPELGLGSRKKRPSSGVSLLCVGRESKQRCRP